jgi:hypothetical protein
MVLEGAIPPSLFVLLSLVLLLLLFLWYLTLLFHPIALFPLLLKEFTTNRFPAFAIKRKFASKFKERYPLPLPFQASSSSFHLPKSSLNSLPSKLPP